MPNDRVKVTVSKTTTFKISDYLNLGHLRDVVEECQGLDPSARVTIETHYGQRDSYEGMTLTVHGA